MKERQSSAWLSAIIFSLFLRMRGKCKYIPFAHGIQPIMVDTADVYTCSFTESLP